MERSDQTLSRLRQLIESQDFSEGRMPPERALASELGVGRRSLRRALDILEQEGRIQRHQGRGTFVQPQAGRPGGMAVTSAMLEGGTPISALGLQTAASIDHLPGLALEHILDHTNPLEV